MSTTTVRLTRIDDRIVFVVAVYSLKRKGFKASTTVTPEGSTERTAQLVFAAAAACAEHLAEKYREPHDPSACGRRALEELRRLLLAPTLDASSRKETP